MDIDLEEVASTPNIMAKQDSRPILHLKIHKKIEQVVTYYDQFWQPAL